MTFRSLHSWKKAKDFTYLLLDLSGFEDETLRWYEIAQWPSCFFLFVGNQNPYTWPCLQFMPCDFLLRHFPLDKQDGSNKTSSLLIYIYDLSVHFHFGTAHSTYLLYRRSRKFLFERITKFQKNHRELQSWGSRHMENCFMGIFYLLFKAKILIINLFFMVKLSSKKIIQY